ncbi:hypothetical protein AB0H83_29525 [Dactylosporangium sp. NPDC050688]|uniref:8-oxoguanine DNA glycosylase OGG fold protein n=1 Tax=Dactylosporangium sp. NPDC050688 TaxID=3157217 RepID=UPI0033FF0086
MTSDLRDLVGSLPAPEQVAGHGSHFRPTWWQRRIKVSVWTDFLVALPEAEQGRGYRRITRGDVLALGEQDGQDTPAKVLVAAYAWGTGPWGFLVARRSRVFRDNEPLDILARLTDALDRQAASGPEAAYRSLLRRNENWLQHLGPSFFTKALYFGGAGALILDRFVAIALNHIEGWGLSTTGPWRSAAEYERWLRYATAQAETSSRIEGREIRPDAVELALFRYGRRIARL